MLNNLYCFNSFGVQWGTMGSGRLFRLQFVKALKITSKKIQFINYTNFFYLVKLACKKLVLGTGYNGKIVVWHGGTPAPLIEYQHMLQLQELLRY